VRAVVWDRYGPPEVLRIEDVPQPVPRPDEVLIQVHAATVNRTDAEVRAGQPLAARIVSGFPRPRRAWRILGTEVAGVVVAKGSLVSEFAIGDEVFGVNAYRFGTHAEFVCMREGAALAHKPSGESFAEAAAVCDGAMLALGCLRHANLTKGRSILIYGASGSIGTAAVQLARYFGAEVTAVCRAANSGLVRSLGADRVIDFTKEDFTKNGQAYDAVFDAVGKVSFPHCKGSLRPGGKYLATDHLSNLARAQWTRFSDRQVVFPVPPRYTKQDVLFLKQLMEAGKYRAVVDRRYPLDQVLEATRYVATGQKIGNVVLTVIS
jgi:NADPH:quinone reductase-like Zn-dependent oxidoreductase